MADSIPHDVSKYTIMGKIKNSPDYFLINILTGGADIVDEETAIKFKCGVYPQKDDLIKKGYLINKEDEKLLFINSYCESGEQAKNAAILIHFIPWLACNLACDFCPYNGIKNKKEIVSGTVVQSFFSYLDRTFAHRQKIIALSGGEPFLPGEQYKEVISGIFNEAGSRGIPVKINTNGYYLHSYIPDLQNKNIQAINICLDYRNTPFGYKNNHPDSNDFFNQLAAGIGKSLENELSTHITILVDQQNIETLHLLAAYAEQNGWTDNPFFTADIISRDNMFLCGCMHRLFPSRANIAEDLYNHILKYPEILELYCPPLSVTHSLFELNYLPLPVFKACPGGISELVCTLGGRIYPCIAAMMSPDESFGTFYPEITVKKETVEAWDERDITTIKKCTDCSYQLGCGGSCTIKAKETSGNYLSPYCVPVKEFMEMGLSLYFDKNLISKE